MKFTILFAILPLLASAAPAAPQASQLGPSISHSQGNEQALDAWALHRAENIKNGINPNNIDAPAAAFAGEQIGHFYKRAIKETYYVDLFNKNYMWVNVEDTTTGTSKWEHRLMLTSGGPTYSSAAPASAVSTAKSSPSSAAKSSSSAAKSSSSASKSATSSASKAAVISVSASAKVSAAASSASSKAAVASSSSKAAVSSSSKAAVSSSSSKAVVSSSSSKAAAVSVSASAKVSVSPASSSKAAVSSSSSKAVVSSSASKAVVSSSVSKAAVSSSVSKAAVSSSVSKAAVSSSVSKAVVSSASKAASVSVAPASSTSKAAAVVSSSASKSATSSASSAAASATGGVSAADQAQFVTLHNNFRAKYTAGKVTWDDSLAAFALKTAQTCKYGHTGGPNGENIAAGVGGGYNIEKAFNSWANEDALYNFSKPGYSSTTGHFTQIVWKGTSKIGCAAASCADGTIFTGYGANSTYVVCEYQTPGNIVSSDPSRTAQLFTANVGPKA